MIGTTLGKRKGVEINLRSDGGYDIVVDGYVKAVSRNYERALVIAANYRRDLCAESSNAKLVRAVERL